MTSNDPITAILDQLAACHEQITQHGHMLQEHAAALTELTSIEDLDPGDLVLTGTPGGVALGVLEGAVTPFVPVSWTLVIEFGLFVLVLIAFPGGVFARRGTL